MKYRHGIDMLHRIDGALRGRRIGLITNPSGMDSDFRSTIDIFFQNYKLVRLFSPEHGVRGDRQAGEKVSGYTDEKTGIRVESLYSGSGDTIDPDGLDCVVYDIQDIGVRCYSYTYTMAKAMKCCADAGIPFVVPDRYNPLGLNRTEGSVIEPKYDSGVGGFGLPSRHGLTIGELAEYINHTRNYGCELIVCECAGLDRSMDYRSCSVPWVMPSPNCPTFDTVMCYTGTVLFEGTNVSEGRGTTKPFEYIGAPWLRNDELADTMENFKLEGVRFRSVCFRPAFSKYCGETCRGLQLHITDYDRFEPFRCGLTLLNVIRKMHSEFEFTGFIDLLAGTDRLRKPDFDVDKFISAEQSKLSEFEEKTRQYHLYRTPAV